MTEIMIFLFYTSGFLGLCILGCIVAKAVQFLREIGRKSLEP